MTFFLGPLDRYEIEAEEVADGGTTPPNYTHRSPFVQQKLKAGTALPRPVRHIQDPAKRFYFRVEEILYLKNMKFEMLFLTCNSSLGNCFSRKTNCGKFHSGAWRQAAPNNLVIRKDNGRQQVDTII